MIDWKHSITTGIFIIPTSSANMPHAAIGTKSMIPAVNYLEIENNYVIQTLFFLPVLFFSESTIWWFADETWLKTWLPNISSLPVRQVLDDPSTYLYVFDHTILIFKLLKLTCTQQNPIFLKILKFHILKSLEILKVPETGFIHGIIIQD